MKDNLTSSIHLFSIKFLSNSKEDPISTLIAFVHKRLADRIVKRCCTLFVVSPAWQCLVGKVDCWLCFLLCKGG